MISDDKPVTTEEAVQKPDEVPQPPRVVTTTEYKSYTGEKSSSDHEVDENQ